MITSTQCYGTTYPAADSPVETVRKRLSQGDGEWEGFDDVYFGLKAAAQAMAENEYRRCGYEHVGLMAIMGCGPEGAMRAELQRLTLQRPGPSMSSRTSSSSTSEISGRIR